LTDIRLDNLISKISPRILIVEDELLIAKGIQRCLRTYNYPDTHIALNGEKALDRVSDIQPNIILMDIMLKGDMDGIQTAKEIRSQYDIPVIYLTSYSDKTTIERAKQTEPYGYILKPFDEKELISSIEIAIHKHQIERRLREREKWYLTVLKSIGDAVITTDAKGIITFMNPVAEMITGYEYHKAIGQKLSDIFFTVNEDSGIPENDPVTKALKEGTAANLEKDILLIAIDGTKKPIIKNVAPIKDDYGTIIGAVIAFQDFSKHKKLD
jgi:PAS domain S-box-containing protein